MQVRLLLPVLIVLLLQACSLKPRTEKPAPIYNTDGSNYVPAPAKRYPQAQQPETLTTSSAVEITPIQAPAELPMKPAQNQAVTVLQKRARDQIASGDLSNAAISLERALSIEPENASSWHLLASLRETEKNFDMAEQMAARSNSFADNGETALQKANWLLIARVRQQQGNSQGASQARKQADLLN